MSDEDARQLDENSPRDVAAELRRLWKIGERIGAVNNGRILPVNPFGDEPVNAQPDP
jgi:hypothetical protein